MLYDPKWSKNDLASFVAWLETKNPNETYEFKDPYNCALGQYSRHIGATPPDAINQTGEEWGIGFYGALTILKRETFGECLHYARVALAGK
jgi:hypothetical protein